MYFLFYEYPQQISLSSTQKRQFSKSAPKTIFDQIKVQESSKI